VPLEQVRTFAHYARWANNRVGAAIGELDEAAYRRDGGAFFGSIHGTWNHLLVGDRIWFHRFGVAIPKAEQPTALDQILYDDRDELMAARRRMDETVLAFVDRLDAAALAREVSYANSRGERFEQPLWQLLAHVFNHQTHHRGQVHALLTGLGREAPPLDLIYYLREHPQVGSAAS
jgi:uncharacterized damage-inducible protein DinB